MKNRQVIRLTESELHRIVKESVKRVLMEEQGYFANEEPYYVVNPYRNDKGFCEWFEKLTFKPQEYDVRNKLSRQQWNDLYGQYKHDAEQRRISNDIDNGKNRSVSKMPNGDVIDYPNGEGNIGYRRIYNQPHPDAYEWELYKPQQ